MWKGIQETQILVGTLLCTCCVTPGELVDWPLWALVPSLKKGRNAPTLPTLHGLVGITWQSTWERLWKRFGPAHRKVPGKGSGSRQKTGLLSRTGVSIRDVQPPHLALRLAPSKHRVHVC